MEQYEKVAKGKYDFNKPYDINGCPYTHKFYISGTEAKLKKGWQFYDSAELENVVNRIMTMSGHFDTCCAAQGALIHFREIFTKSSKLEM